MVETLGARALATGLTHFKGFLGPQILLHSCFFPAYHKMSGFQVLSPWCSVLGKAEKPQDQQAIDKRLQSF